MNDPLDRTPDPDDVWIRIDGRVVRGARVTVTPRRFAQAAAAVALLVGTVALAAPGDTVPHTFTSGGVISAAQMNENFTEVTTQIGEVASTTSLGGTYSSSAIYRGTTATTFTGALGGYAGAKAACETALASPTAHMCTAEELVRTHATGRPVGNGVDPMWYATGSRAMWPPTDPIAVSDCESYTVGTSGARGASFSAAGQLMDVTLCDTSLRIACCDS